MPEQNLTDRAFNVIERLIVLQEIPPGSLISEKQLMEHTGIGRTPVREALQRLARDRMVEIHPNRGVLVPASSIEAQLKLLELRRQLEPFAARLAAARAKPDQRERARELAQSVSWGRPLRIEAFPDFLRAAHDLIVSSAQNEFISIAMVPLQGLSRRFWFANLAQPESELARASELHARILQSVAEGAEGEAEAASLALNDYLTEFAYRTLPPRAGA
jgi:DNA-binding GntR family transcriptional regulator